MPPIYLPPDNQPQEGIEETSVPSIPSIRNDRCGGRVVAMFLADYASLKDGLLTVVGGLLTTVNYVGKLGVLGRDLVLFVETDGVGIYDLGVRIVDAKDAILVEGIAGEYRSTRATIQPHVIPLRALEIPAPGLYTITVAISDTWVASLDFTVILDTGI